MTRYLIEAATLAGIFTIASMGLFILTGLTGQISLTQATYIGVGALVSSYCARSSLEFPGQLPGLGMSFPLSLLVGAAVTAIVAALFGAAFIRLRGSAAISASIASSVVVLYLCERLVFLSGGSKGATSSSIISFGNTNFSELTIGSHQFSPEIGLLILVVLIMLFVYLYTRNITISPLGRSMRTVRERDMAAQTCEISPRRTIVNAHFLCGFAAGVAGGLYAHVLQSFEISSTNPWIGVFGIIASTQILAYVVLSRMKNLHVTIVTVFGLTLISVFFSRAAASLSLFDAAQGSKISTSSVTAIVTSLLVLVVLIMSEWLHKRRL